MDWDRRPPRETRCRRWKRYNPDGGSWSQDQVPTPLVKVSAGEAKGDDGFAGYSCLFLQLFDETGFDIVRIRHHLAGGNLLVGRALIAQLANTKSALGTDGWPENPAGHGA